ncbi:hypothetical protein D779_1752 [Imhoffiella purpurea]|uniref:Uncharacterized protein n=1 Tax=Imhoffiella purpurea TaxID=1249627 RepID=W9VBX9_9GAMM|nr:hypothetical protein D779_1752 [Imhoffiella purpurea]
MLAPGCDESRQPRTLGLGIMERRVAARVIGRGFKDGLACFKPIQRHIGVFNARHGGTSPVRC